MATEKKQAAGKKPSGATAKPAPVPARAPAPPAKMPMTLAELLATAREMAELKTAQSEIIEWICKVANHYYLRVRYDEHVPDSQVVPVAPAVPTPAATVVAAAEIAAVVAQVDEPTVAIAPDAEKKTSKARKRGKVVPVQTYRLKDGSRILVLEQLINPEQFEDEEVETGDDVAPLPSKEPSSCRLVLSCNRKNVRTTTPICGECNGAVIDTRAWKMLSVPPRAFNPRPAPREIDAHLAAGAYDLIHVDDGTVVTIYRWDHPKYGPVWDLASSNGYGISTLKWMGAKTYAEIVFEVMSMYPAFIRETKASLVRVGEGETRIHFGALSPQKSYTIGFRHHDFHPMLTDPQRMWQIQSVDLATGAASYGEGGLPGIPYQTKGDITSLTREIFGHRTAGDVRALPVGIPRPALQKFSTRVEHKGDGSIAFDHLVTYGVDSLEIAKEYVAERRGDKAANATALPAHIHYGFILRSRDVAVTGEHSDFLVESSLLRRVRKLVYERPPKSMRADVDHLTRLEFNALRSHLTATERETFESIFPQWRARFIRYDEFIGNIIALIRQLHRQEALGVAAPNPAHHTAAAKLAASLLAHITKFENIGAFHKETDSIIRDYVATPEYALLYLRAMASDMAASEAAKARKAAPESAST